MHLVGHNKTADGLNIYKSTLGLLTASTDADLVGIFAELRQRAANFATVAVSVGCTSCEGITSGIESSDRRK